MRKGRTEENKKATKKTGFKTAKTLLKVVGVVLAAGVALIATTDKTMSKAFSENDEKENQPDEEIAE